MNAALKLTPGQLAAPATSAAPEIGATPGHILTPGVDDVLAALEREGDYVKDRAEMFEGRVQTPAELEQWQKLFSVVQKEANKRLNMHQVHLGACAPNDRGYGAVFIGFDSDGRKYDVTLGIPMEERRNLEAAGRETFVRTLIDMVCSAVLERRENYLRRGGLQ